MLHFTARLPRSRFIAAALIWVAVAAPAMAEVAQTPFVVDEDKLGHAQDNFTLRFCVDPRDPAWEIDQQIGNALAATLLLQPAATVISDPSQQNDFDDIYRHLLADCDMYFGFKLLSGDYPDWVTITRAYYNVNYVFVGKDPSFKQLSDIPTTQALGPTVGTSGDLRLVLYLNSLPEAQRWHRYPMGTDEFALEGAAKGDVAAAYVWAPSFYALEKTNPDFAAMKLIGSAPLPEQPVGVGAVMLSNNSFLRSNVDQAIGSLIADGTIQKILDDNHFPASLPK